METLIILPPETNGKVSGFLSLFVKEIKVLQNLYLLSKNCGLLIQIQWWGEILPAYIRPNVQHYKQHRTIKCESYHIYSNPVKYAIKTKLELFKSYLESCEVLEFTVFDAVENLIIGSAFLKNLIGIISLKNENVTIPLINFSGEKIGYIIININFITNSEEISNEYNERSFTKSWNTSNLNCSNDFSVSTNNIFGKIYNHKKDLTIYNGMYENILEKIGNLNFDLSNPIEKNYYEKFFLQPNCLADSNNDKELHKSEYTTALKNKKINHIKAFSKNFQNEGDILNFSSSLKEYINKSYCLSLEHTEFSKIDSLNCIKYNYQKKLDELDTLIKSLKELNIKILKNKKKELDTEFFVNFK